MKKIKWLIVFVLLCTLSCFFINKNNVNANTNLVGMTKSDGTALKYFGSNEQVQMLSEFDFPTSEFRAMWVSTYAGDISSYTSKSQFQSMMNTVLDNMQSLGMNAIIFQVRSHNNAYYNSSLNPLCEYWSSVDFSYFDPLAWLIEETHNRGMEFHAWLNPYRVSTNGKNPDHAAESLPAANPASDVNNLIKVGSKWILNPGKQVVRDFLVDTCLELVENYDVDAIHFDDYFYIEGYTSSETDDEKRENINMFIESLHNALVEFNTVNKKAVQLGIAPSGIYRSASSSSNYPSEPTYDENGNLTNPVYSGTNSSFQHYGNYLYADTLHWINNEWIDYILPQTYWGTEHYGASYIDLCRWYSWAVRYKKVNFYSAVGWYMSTSSSASSAYWQNLDEVEREILYARTLEECKGTSFYTYKTLTTSHSAITEGKEFLKNTWAKKKIPGAIIPSYAGKLDKVTPSNVIYNTSNGNVTFNSVTNARGYMIYQVPRNETLNQNNINHLYTYIQSTSINLPNVENYKYYIASVNLANEISEVTRVIASEQDKVDFTVSTLSGVQIRTTEPNGIKFTGKVTGPVEGKDIKYGIVFGKGIHSNLTINSESAAYAEVTETTSDGEFYITMIKFPQNAYSMYFTARAYVYVDGEYYYAEEHIIKSLYETAKVYSETLDYLETEIIENILNNTSLYNVTFDSNESVKVSDQYSTRIEMVEDFVADFNAYSGKNVAANGSDFFDRSYANDGTTFGYNFLISNEYKNKWGWVLTYINKVRGTDLSASDGQAVSRGEIHCFLNELNTYDAYNASGTYLGNFGSNYTDESIVDAFWDMNINGENSINTVNNTAILTLPTREGYVFDGWYDNAICSGNQVCIINKNMTLYAKWVKA